MAHSVFVVDDHSFIREVLVALIEVDHRLSVWGTAVNGLDAVRQVADHCPDAIVCDIQMPVMDGLTALPLLRSACPDSVVVIYSSNPDVAAATALGAAAVFDKITSPDEMLEAVVALCA